MNKPAAATDAACAAAAESAAEADEFDAAAADAAAAFGGGTSTHLNEDLSGAVHKEATRQDAKSSSAILKYDNLAHLHQENKRPVT
jgi:hypothetical protein